MPCTRWFWLPSATATRSEGAKRPISESQLYTSDVGATTMDARSSRLSLWAHSSSAMTCSVLPRPMSSASTPPMCSLSSACIHMKPRIWYGLSMLPSGSGHGSPSVCRLETICLTPSSAVTGRLLPSSRLTMYAAR